MAYDTSINVLIVDDYQSMRRTIADIMRHLGFRSLFYAEDGKQALRRLDETPIGLMVLDWDMPVMTGIEVLRQMRSSEKWKELPVIMVTAVASRETVWAPIDSGVTNYIVKPFTPQTLEKKIRQVFAKPAEAAEPVPFKPPAA
jgi:two-component system chemotaxis response regulator CheY